MTIIDWSESLEKTAILALLKKFQGDREWTHYEATDGEHQFSARMRICYGDVQFYELCAREANVNIE